MLNIGGCVMILKICPHHQVRYRRGGRCPLCPGERDSASWHEIRARVLARDGHRCTFYSGALVGAPLTTGTRCPERTNLEVAHLDPRARGGSDSDESRLITLCHAHHLALEAAQRAAGGY